MKLSIIVPIYNTSKYLENCIQSLIVDGINDTYEIIAINDGSTDNSLDILQKYKDKLNIVNNTNHGVSYSRNIGIEKAHGDFIMFVDSDDLLKDGWQNKIFPLLNDETKDVIFISKHEEILSENLFELVSGINKFNVCLASACSNIYNKSFILKNKIRFNEKIIHGEDMLFNLNVLLYVNNIGRVNLSYYDYRIYMGSSSRKINDYIFQSDLIFQSELNNILNHYNFDDSKINNIKQEFLKNALIMLFNRISLLSNYRDAKNKYKLLNRKPYTDIRLKFNFKNIKKNFVVFLFKIHCYYILFYAFKLKNKFI